MEIYLIKYYAVDQTPKMDGGLSDQTEAYPVTEKAKTFKVKLDPEKHFNQKCPLDYPFASSYRSFVKKQRLDVINIRGGYNGVIARCWSRAEDLAKNRHQTYVELLKYLKDKMDHYAFLHSVVYQRRQPFEYCICLHSKKEHYFGDRTMQTPCQIDECKCEKFSFLDKGK